MADLDRTTTAALAASRAHLQWTVSVYRRTDGSYLWLSLEPAEPLTLIARYKGGMEIGK